MKLLPLTKGKFALVDDKNWDRVVSGGPWHFAHGYAVHSAWYVDGGYWFEEKLHNFLKTPPIGMEWDHIDTDKLNNQEHNLRAVTRSQNGANRTKRVGSSLYKGVSWHKRICRWQAYICKEGKRQFLGTFLREEDAALAYNKAANKLFGEYARVNIIGKPGETVSTLHEIGNSLKVLGETETAPVSLTGMPRCDSQSSGSRPGGVAKLQKEFEDVL